MSKVIEVNFETNEKEIREMTAEERAELEARQKQLSDEQVAKAEAKTKREALLARLGITEEEAKLLLG